MASPKRDDETMEGYVIRLIREEERERCAQIAMMCSVKVDFYDGSDASSPAMGRIFQVRSDIAKAIREQP